jgi:hypothetical protein
MEEMIHDCFFTHMLEDPFVVSLEMMSSPDIFEIIRFIFICNLSNELMTNKLWSEHVQIRRETNKMMAWLHWHFHFT